MVVLSLFGLFKNNFLMIFILYYEPSSGEEYLFQRIWSYWRKWPPTQPTWFPSFSLKEFKDAQAMRRTHQRHLDDPENKTGRRILRFFFFFPSPLLSAASSLVMRSIPTKTTVITSFFSFPAAEAPSRAWVSCVIWPREHASRNKWLLVINSSSRWTAPY